MSDRDPDAPPPSPVFPGGQDNPFQPAIIVYLLYIGGIFVPFLALGGLVYAYVERGRDAAVDSHLDFLIRTFWWGLLMLVVGFVASFILVGILLLIFWLVWLLVRVITGIQLAQKRKPITAIEMFGLKAI